MSAVYVKEYTAPPLDRREILRYLRTETAGETLERELNEALKEALPVLSYRLCYAEFALGMAQGEIDLGFARVASRDLAKNLAGCTHVVVFAATLGVGLDRLIARYSNLSPIRALCLQAIGAERIEALCDCFCTDLRYASFGGRVHARFSPGYGDLPLDFQRHIFRVLEPPRRIGLTLNESLLMSPTKSVSALVGIE